MVVFEGNKYEIMKLRVRQKEIEMYTSLIISIWAIVLSFFTSVDALKKLTESCAYIFPILSIFMFLICIYEISKVKEFEQKICELECATDYNKKYSDHALSDSRTYEVIVKDYVDLYK